MKILYSFACLLVSIMFYGQKINIDWNGYQIYDFGITQKKLPKFKTNLSSARSSYDRNNLFINIKHQTNTQNLKITNLIWETVAAKNLYDLSPELISTDEIKSISYPNRSTDANISLNLFKRENRTIKRLVSFNIVKDNSKKLRQQLTFVGTTDNPLSNGNFYKIKVNKTGIYKITYQFLQQNGINPANINPQNFRVYGNGGIMLPEFNQDTKYSALQEDAIQLVGGEDGVWNENDYALFYAQGSDGYNLYDYTNGNGFVRRETRTDQPNHLKNIYNDNAYYFINFDIGAGKRVPTLDGILPSNLITDYDAYQFIDQDQINLLKLGRTWVQETAFVDDKNISFNTPISLNANDDVKYRVRVIGYKSQQNSIDFSINGQDATNIDVPNGNEYYSLVYKGSVNGLNGQNINIQLSPNVSTNPNGLFYLDYAEVQYKQSLIFNGGQMNFRDFGIESGSNQRYGFSVANASDIEQIWDVTDITNAKRLTNKGDNNNFKFAYTADNPYFNNEFVAFKASAAYEPGFVGKIANQNLHGLQNIDYLMITQPEMMSQAQRLADYHQNKNNLTVKVVDVNKIYNEYSSGSKDLTAIRDFVTQLNTPNGSLKYVFLLGDSSFDYKDKYPNNDNIIFGYQSENSADFINSYITDDYIVMTSPQTTGYISNIIPDLPVGRLPASNLTEAKEMIDKTLAYYNALPGQSSPFGIWRLNLDFIADDDKDGGTPFHTIMDQDIVHTFESNNTKPEYHIKKLYLDAFSAQSSAGGQRYPQINQAISSDIGNALFMFYFGHGGPYGWAQERILTTDEIGNFNNFSSIYSRFPLVSTITCEFTLWDNPDIFSSGEQVMKKEDGGAATMITSSRGLSVYYGINFSGILIDNIFDNTQNNDFKSLGDAYLNARRIYGANSNHMKVNFLGDPAMKLSKPKNLIQIDEIQTPTPNLIRALDFVTVKGRVNKEDGTLDTDFNGKVVLNVFDKLINKSTLNNDGDIEPILNYIEEGNAIVKTAGKVENGVFTVKFYVPKDINYTVGEGRILTYADNGEKDVYNNMPYQIGGINPDGIQDDEPPVAHLYLNNTNFVNGGITNKDPMLLVCLTDNTGINATGAGVGHDITTYLDGQVINTKILNDYYSPGEGNGCKAEDLEEFQKGSVTYPLRGLKKGKHTLTFKVWDINNNSTTESLEFIVKDPNEDNLVINRLLNWPNPFTDKTYIQFEHNCDDILEVNVQIYTITGKLVRNIRQTVSAEPYLEGYRTPRQAIEWDGKDDFGSNVAKGTYIYKVFVKSTNPEKCKGTAQAIEKMVILK
ncbi:MAG: hypothetical protein CSA38_03970 [Flavobacteriales bacterium]|nr:MAG: hypothetical protein CSA38_03970 [Flavobacteriales bacterium]